MNPIKITQILFAGILVFVAACQGKSKEYQKPENLKWQLLLNTITSEDPEGFDYLWIDFSAIEKLENPERAALAYVSSQVGNKCEQDGGVEEEEYYLNCILTSALGLGYQCEDVHLEFLQTWFKNDSISSVEIESCYLIPYTATAQTAITQIKIAKQKDKIFLNLEAGGIFVREDLTWEWK
jgi:hypothetical protein